MARVSSAGCERREGRAFTPTSARRWVLQRGYRYGNSASCVDLDLRPGLMTRLRLLAIGSYRIFKGLFFLPLTWPFGRHLSIMYLRHICVGAGFLTGLFGTRYEEYRTTHGS